VLEMRQAAAADLACAKERRRVLCGKEGDPMERRNVLSCLLAAMAAPFLPQVSANASLDKKQQVVRMRRVEILYDGRFIPTQFSALKKGDHFRLFDDHPDGAENGAVNVATSDASPCSPVGNWVVEANPVNLAIGGSAYPKA